jgi:hypothetical protein
MKAAAIALPALGLAEQTTGTGCRLCEGKPIKDGDCTAGIMVKGKEARVHFGCALRLEMKRQAKAHFSAKKG